MGFVLAVTACARPAGTDDHEYDVAVTRSALTASEGHALCAAYPGKNVIVGSDRNDVLFGTSRADCIVAGKGNDVVSALGGDDVVFAGEGHDLVYAGPGNDLVFGDAGYDLLLGDGGRDTLYGGADADVLSGGSDNDVLWGEQGDDFVSGDDGDDTVWLGDGNDKAFGGDGADEMHGGDGADFLDGQAGNDALFGEGCHDRLFPGFGSGTQSGGPGTDACSGTDCERPQRLLPACLRDRDCSSSDRCVVQSGVCVPKTAERCEQPSQPPACTPTASNDATCDGRDDDCDGRIDEDYAPRQLACGTGACARTRLSSCVGGVADETCTPGTPAASDDNCNAVDDDCNGLTDEDFPVEVTSCGVGRCAAHGERRCVEGGINDSCVPAAALPSDTSCDGVDDDCDGTSDESYVAQPIGCGVGACAATGTTVCNSGQVQNSCTSGTGSATDDVCNGVDDDCDGDTDEEYGIVVHACGVGACERQGNFRCVAGEVQDECVPAEPSADDDCDGVDDDCDGTSDEHYVALPTRCGVGACASTGSTHCINGTVTDSCSAGTPAQTDATCDGVDDDCDGTVDDEYVSMVVPCGVGGCASLGTTHCVDGAVVASCTPGTPASTDDVCNAVDDDCDERTDEEFVPAPSTCGVGACARGGMTTCVEGGLVDSCVAGEPAPQDANCDGVDDDCDGSTDEGYVPVATSCGTGGCARSGQLRCIEGSEQDDCQPGEPAPTDAVCDGVDEDCDGSSDEDSCDDGNACTADQCDPMLGCGHVANAGSACTDGDVCTHDDRCDADGACGGQPVETDDDNPCTDDVCDPSSGVAHHVAVGRGCDDGDACTVSDSCDASGACVATTTRDCNDGVFCNGAESCEPQGGCAPGTPPSIDDGIACTSDSCDEAQDRVVHLGNDAACDDHDVCSGREACEPGFGCRQGTPLAVDDGNTCTADACDATQGVTHTALAAGTPCASASYCDGAGQCQRFAACASNLVLSPGQNLTMTGPCEINAITFNGGSLTINGSLKTPTVTMNSGGTLRVVAGALLANATTLSNGTVSVDGIVTGSVRQSNGSFRLGGRLVAASAADFNLTGGTFTNEGEVQLPVFDASVVSGGTFVNRGRLRIASELLTVAPNVTLNESGTLGSDDSIAGLTVASTGVVTHDPKYAPGVHFTVTGNASVSGAIDATGRGLNGALELGTCETYAADQSTIINVTVRAGGSHAGLGGGLDPVPTYGMAGAPELLGSGGAGAVGALGGNGGGRVDLVVHGTLNVTGAIRANGGSGWFGGGGGSVRLRAGSLTGTGTLSALGGPRNDPRGNGGGGGRVAVEYATRAFTGALSAGGAQQSGAGTVYVKNTTTGAAEVIIDNPGATGTTVLRAAELSDSALRIASGAVVLRGALSRAAGQLTLQNGTVTVSDALTLSAGALSMTGGTLLNTGRIDIAAFDGSVVSAGSFINRGRLDIASDALTIPANVTFVESGSLGASDSIGALTVASGGVLTHDPHSGAGLAFRVTGNASVAGAIDVNGRGLTGGVDTTGLAETYAADQSTIISVLVRAGGTHGGAGGGTDPAPTYGMPAAPVLLGSGGGGGINGQAGGAGGGRVDLEVLGTLNVTGTVRANGAVGFYGGAGGSLRLRAGTLTGTGTLSVLGGTRSDPRGNGGGGGRLALEYATRTFTGTISASGALQGGAGTVYLKNTSTGVAEVSIDNGAATGSTPLRAAELSGSALRVVVGNVVLRGVLSRTAGQLTLQGGTLTVQDGLSLSAGALSMTGGTLINTGTIDIAAFDGSVASGGSFLNRGRLNVASDQLTVPANVTFSENGSLGANDSIGGLTVASGGVLTHDARATAGLAFTVTGNASVAGSIDVSGRGLNGGVDVAPSETYAADQTTIVNVTVSAGGSHGGLGGGTAPAPTYGLAGAPVHLGSGGGGGPNASGGAGGGRVDLVVLGSLGVTGTIRANGAAGFFGGAGGSLRLRVGSLTGTGTLSAQGGANNDPRGNGGGGGRIAIEARSTSFTGSIDASGRGAAGAGSVLQRDLTSVPATVTPQLSAGALGLCELSTRGALACRGDDSDRLVSLAPLGVFTRVALGPYAACALHDSGIASCWAGVDSARLRDTPVVRLSELGVGLRAACGVRASDGELVCWGDANDSIVTARPSGSFTQVAVGDTAACAVSAAGLVSCWGSDTGGAVSERPTAAVTRVEGGEDFFCAVLTSGALSCWGDDGSGQTSAPAGVGYGAVSAGKEHACALDAAGLASCWGDDSEGQLHAPGQAFVAVAAGDAFSCGLPASGTAVCWGAVPTPL